MPLSNTLASGPISALVSLPTGFFVDDRDLATLDKERFLLLRSGFELEILMVTVKTQCCNEKSNI